LLPLVVRVLYAIIAMKVAFLPTSSVLKKLFPTPAKSRKLQEKKINLGNGLIFV
jgi:hypothetical protein